MGEFTVDPATHTATDGGADADRVSAARSAVSRPGEAVQRRELTRVGWPHGAIVHENTLDAYIARIRRKLRTLPDTPAVHTVHGIGYSLR